MTTHNHHRVHLIDVTIGADSQFVQTRLARSYWERIVGDLETVFDSVVGPNETLRLDRLEIDLGEVGGVEWEPAFRNRLVAELTRSLAELKPARHEGQGQSCSSPGGPLELFVFFLTHGRLPWWGTRGHETWTETVSPVLDEIGWNALRTVATNDVRARVRLVDSMSDAFLEEALSRWSALPHAALVFDRLTPKDRSAASIRQWRRYFWIRLLDQVLTDRFRLQSGPAILRELLMIRGGCFELSEGGHAGLCDMGGTSPLEDEIRGSSPGVRPHPWREWQLEGEAAGAPQPPAVAVHSTQAESASRSVVSVGRRANEPKEAAPPTEDSDAIYLKGAGAIILHPFLEELFRDRALLVGREFRDATARHAAAHLLGWLGFGKPDVPEYDLLLAKALCGCPFEEPLEPVLPDESDRAACDALLHAVLGHWTALRSDSPEWLREAFLLREGKLERVDQGWRLTVERHAQDVLLARLPWGFGVVGLPWLQERIFVHWLD